MIDINQSKINNNFTVKANGENINCIVVEKPFYDPKKKIASS